MRRQAFLFLTAMAAALLTAAGPAWADTLALLTALMLLVATATPALAARPSDPEEGCEHQKAQPIEGYCDEQSL